jgi:hypothetical protein
VRESSLHCFVKSLKLAGLLTVGSAEEIARLRSVAKASANKQLRDHRVKLELVGKRQDRSKGRWCYLNPSRFHYWTVGSAADRSPL